jgi:hypothetical protein
VVLLLILGIAVRVSGLGLHSLNHKPGVGLLELPVFDAAKHAEDTAHLEAGEVLVYVGCPACLLLHSSEDLPWLAVAPSSIPRAQNLTAESIAGSGECPSSLHHSRAPPFA